MAITYTPTTNFGAKDSLPTNDPDKVIKGSEFTTEFTALQTAFSLAAPNASPTFTGTVTIPTADINGGAIDGTTIGGTTPAAATFTSVTATTADINGGAIDGTVIGAATPAAASFTTVSATGNITVGGTVDGRDVAADGTKLDGIEAGADVTDTTNVTAAGALMDSELTNIAAVKALNQGVATTDSPSFAGLTATTADINGGTIDGAIIGGASAAAGTFTTLNATGGGALTGTWSDLGTVTTVDINGGTIDGATIGGASAGAGTFTNLTATGTTTLAGASTTADITFGDNDKAIFGAGSDLQIYHDGSNSRIDDTGTGNLILRGSSAVSIQKYTGETLGVFNADGSVLLAYDNATKFETTATGIDVTGTVTADDAIYVEGSSPRVQLQDTDGTTQLSFFQQAGEDLILRLRNNTADGGFTVAGYGGASTTNRFYVQPNGDISFYEDTGTTPKFFWDASAESLGIGTSSPSQDLHLYKQNAFLRIQNSDNNYALDLTSNGTVGEIRYSSDLKLMPGGIEAVTLKASGNVGIGTTSPTGMLTLDKDVATLYDATDDDAQRSGTTTLAITNENGTQNTFAQIAFDLAASGQSVARIVALNDGTSTSALAFVTEGSNTKREVMRLDGSGNVGIGTTSPAANLHISGTGNDAKIIIEGSANPRGNFIAVEGADDLVFAADEDNLGASSAMKFRVDAAERMRIDASGNLLVGKTSTSGGIVGSVIASSGLVRLTADGIAVAEINRLTSDGPIVDFRKDGTTVGSIGTVGGYLGIANGDTGLLFRAPYDDILPYTSTGNTAVDAAIDIGDGSYRFKDLFLSGGVYLGGTGAANLLDDYEEGTFTPVIQGATIAGIFTYGTQSGIYTKIGNAVHVYVAINVTATSVSPVGAVTIQGLPFTVSGSYQSLAVGWASGITFADQLNAYVPNAETFVVLRNSVSGGNGNQIAGSNLSSSFWIFVSGTYRA